MVFNQQFFLRLAMPANKKIMSPAGGLGHKQAGGFAIVACLFVPHI
tara:strand:+ start:306 stop:443 length:138 start_codon:yes stop_codon:yes gene_type:complete